MLLYVQSCYYGPENSTWPASGPIWPLKGRQKPGKPLVVRQTSSQHHYSPSTVWRGGGVGIYTGPGGRRRARRADTAVIVSSG